MVAIEWTPRLEQVDENCSKIDEILSGISADLIVLPELSSTGYFFTSADTLRPHSESALNGSFNELIRAHSLSSGAVIVAGFAERDGDRLYNSALIALPSGEWSIYRKTHLFYKEKLVFEQGDRPFEVVEWDGMRVGTMICYDWRFPEAARTLAVKGADIIAHPSNLVAPYAMWGPVMRTRAFENRMATVTANRAGWEVRDGERLDFSGHSQIVAHDGAIAARSTGESMIVSATIDIAKCRRKSFNPYNDILTDRRPDLYEL